MSEFENITLLECNREQSTEKETDDDNNAIFTNKLGKVVELNVGDTISVKSAFINKRGSGNLNSIEFKGNSLGVSAKFIQTSKATEEPTEYSLENKYPEVIYTGDITSNLQTDFEYDDNSSNDQIAFRQIYNEEVELDIRDNEAHLETQYYKNVNGEGYVYQPRPFVRSSDYEISFDYPFYTFGLLTPSLWNRSNFDMDFSNIASHPSQTQYKKGDNSGVSRYLPDYNEGSGLNYLGIKYYEDIFLKEDYHKVMQPITYEKESSSHGNEPYKKTTQSYYRDDYGVGTEITDSVDYADIRPRHDNKRFTLFEREYDWFVWPNDVEANAETGFTPPKVPNHDFLQPDGSRVKINAETWFTSIGLPTGFPQKYRRSAFRSPALFNYIKQSKINTIKVNKGYSTPQSLSEQITEELQKQVNGSPTTYKFFGSDTSSNDVGFIPTNTLSTSIETGFFKPIQAEGEYYRTGYKTYYGTQADPNTKDAFDWWKSFHNIFIKRPDLYEKGTKINNKWGFVGTPEQQLSSPPDDPRDPSDNTSFGIGNFIWNDIKYNATTGNNFTEPIITGWLYTEHNLKLLSELFDIQGQYPELFYDEKKSFLDNKPFLNKYVDSEGNIEWGEPAKIDNSRFLHINRFDIYEGDGSVFDGGNRFNILGDDGFVKMTYNNGETGDALRTFDTDHRATAFFFKYDKTYRNIDTGGLTTDNLSYGFATKTLMNNGTRKDYYITLHPELVNGLRPEIFNMRGGMTPAINSDGQHIYEQGNIRGRDNNLDGADFTCIGWDYHFSSWGNLVITAFTGYTDNNFNATTRTTNDTDATLYDGDQVGDIKLTYIGSNNLACIYDAVSNRFGFEDLHMPENVGNTYDAGSTDYINSGEATATESKPINDKSSDEVYRINKRLYKWTFSPDVLPMIEQSGEIYTPEQPSGTKGAVRLTPMNNNLVSWTIYDSHMGVNINFGKCCKIDTTKYPRSQREVWNRSMLGILGFSYEQFNPEGVIATKQSRITDNNIRSLYNPTTNAEVLNTDTNLFNMNEYGAVQYTTQLPRGLLLTLNNPQLYRGDEDYILWLYLPSIVKPAQSVRIEGVNLPRVSLHPYMTIRSDLITSTKYIGGRNSGITLPIISVVNTINADRDYVQLEGSEVFTITEPMKFSSITTAITDPDGTLSLLDEGSSIIYKISKLDTMQKYNILEDFKKNIK